MLEEVANSGYSTFRKGVQGSLEKVNKNVSPAGERTGPETERYLEKNKTLEKSRV